MQSGARRLWLGVAMTAALARGCTDVGDSSAVPGADAAAASQDDAGVGLADGAGETSEGGPPESTDAPVVQQETGAVDARVPEVDAGQTTDPDAALEAASVEDTSVPDSTSPDAGGRDATVADGGAGDAGVGDAGAADAGAGDVVADTDVDSAASDTGPDGAEVADAGGALGPCTLAGQVGCVQCQYNNGAGGTLPNTTQLCTPTEAALVQHDIATGSATAPGPDPSGSCYACAASSGCLDDSAFNDKGNECEDLAGAGSASACEATLHCVLGSSCGTTAISACFCGTAPVSGSCAASGPSNAANGACMTLEAAGLGFASSDGLDVLKNFTSTTLPSGVANNIFQCAASNSCDACLK